mgnify:CR=1 FL=1
MYQITFQFENGGKPVIVDATPNTTILDAAKAANVAIDAPCNGNGSCGKCRVKILEGTVESTPTHHISEEDYAAGWRLSCASSVSRSFATCSSACSYRLSRTAASRAIAQPCTPQLCSCPQPRQAREPVCTFSRPRALMSSSVFICVRSFPIKQTDLICKFAKPLFGSIEICPVDFKTCEIQSSLICRDPAAAAP